MADRLNSLTNSGVGNLTVKELMSIFGEENVFSCDMVPGIEEVHIPPANPPITVTRLLCSSVFTFKTSTNEVTNRPYVSAILSNTYIQFNVPGAAQLTLTIPYMIMEAQSNTGTATCLASSGQLAANTINNAVSFVQNLINNQPPGTAIDDIKATARSGLLLQMNRGFGNQLQDCNFAYTGTVTFSTRGAALDYKNWNGTPFTDCDALIINCP